MTRKAIKQHALLSDVEYNFRPKTIKRKKEECREKELKKEVEQWKKGVEDDRPT